MNVSKAPWRLDSLGSIGSQLRCTLNSYANARKGTEKTIQSNVCFFISFSLSLFYCFFSLFFLFSKTSFIQISFFFSQTFFVFCIPDSVTSLLNIFTIRGVRCPDNILCCMIFLIVIQFVICLRNYLLWFFNLKKKMNFFFFIKFLQLVRWTKNPRVHRWNERKEYKL